MSMGLPQAVASHSLNRRLLRNERRWSKWREGNAWLSYLIKSDSQAAAELDMADELYQADRERKLKQVRSNQWRRVRHYAKLLYVAPVTGLSWVFALPIDAWDRWMTVDAGRS